MKTTSKRYVDVTNAAKSKLAKLFKCTETFIYMALTYRKNSEKARKVRYVAIRDYQGKPMHHCPECETLHNTTKDGRSVMVQNFDNGVQLIVDKGNGNVDLFNRKGEQINHWDNVDFPTLSKIQIEAEAM